MFGKKKAGASAAGIALVMALSPVAAIADEAAAVDTGIDVTKNLMLNDGSTVATSFNFSVTKTQLTVQGDEKTAPTSEVPDLTIADIAYTTNGESAGTNTKTSDIKVGAYPHAGIYAWTITETTGSEAGMQYNTDAKTYTLIANVVNGDNGLTATYSVVDGTLTTVPSKQGDATKVDTATFTNKYTESANGECTDLTITKTVAGNQGDKTKDFSFTVTFTAPSVLPAGQTAEQYLAGITVTGATDAVNNNGTVTFKLKDGQTATFANVLAGTKYSVEETAVAGYQQGWTATENGTAGATKQSGLLAGEGENSGTMTNTHNDVTPTGIVINNMPYIVMAGAAVAGVVAYGAAKRKLEQ